MSPSYYVLFIVNKIRLEKVKKRRIKFLLETLKKQMV